jgi:hypothetical protein
MLGFASAIILKYMALAVTQQQPEINVIFTPQKNLTTKNQTPNPNITATVKINCGGKEDNLIYIFILQLPS